MGKPQYLFYNWVPKWLGTIVFILLFVPILFVSGIYPATSTDMASGLGIIPEHIQFSTIAAAIGTATFAPFMVKFMTIRRPKMVYMWGFLMLVGLSYICARTEYLWLLILCCFIMGIIRTLLMFNNLFCMFQYCTGMDPIPPASNVPPTLEHVDKLDTLKIYVRLPFYLFVLAISIVGSSLTTWLAYEYKWQYIYYFMSGLLLVGMIIVLCTMKYQRRLINARLNMKRFGDSTCNALMFLSACFILIYGKTLDWFSSIEIQIAGIVFLISVGLFLIIQINTRNGYFRFGVFRKKYVITAGIVFFLGMVINSSSVLSTMLMGVGMTVDNTAVATLGNYGFIGYVIGFVLCIVFAKKKTKFKYIFVFAFLIMLAVNIYMYFIFQSQALYEDLILPTILRAVGLYIFYAMCPTLGMKRMPIWLVTSWGIIMLSARSILGPTVGSSLYSNWITDRQQYYISRLSTEFDRQNTEVANAYDMSVMGAVAKNKSIEDANIAASSSLKARISRQATLAALKDVCGGTIFLTIGCILIVLILPYKEQKESYTADNFSPKPS